MEEGKRGRIRRIGKRNRMGWNHRGAKERVSEIYWWPCNMETKESDFVLKEIRQSLKCDDNDFIHIRYYCVASTKNDTELCMNRCRR